MENKDTEETTMALAPIGTATSIVLPMPIETNLIVRRQNAVNDVVRTVLRDNEHYGVIPGTGTRKTLLKPGFDILCSTFQLSPDYAEMSGTTERDDFINVVYKCTLTHIPTGKAVASGIGSCNSKEEKYRWKQSVPVCPSCGKETIRRSKDKPEYYCWSKLGGCGQTFATSDDRITPPSRVENDNPYNFHNTLVKMAQKRAGMAAIITACGLSNDFTQDMEDFTESDRQVIEVEVSDAEPDRMPVTERATPLQIKKIYAVLKEKGIKEAAKADSIIYRLAEVKSKTELTKDQAYRLIEHLEEADPESFELLFPGESSE